MSKRVKCRFCKHRWQPRAERPLACPACKRYGWDKLADSKQEVKDVAAVVPATTSETK